MRTVSLEFLNAAYSQETDEVIICLLTFYHEDSEEPIYLSSDPTTRISDNPLIYATYSRGNEYLYLPFEFTLPDDKSDSPPRVQITLDNVNRQLVSLLRSFTSPPTVKLELILASDPDTVEVELPVLKMSSVQITEKNISAELVADSLINEPFPGRSFTPGAFPGLF